jgi:hypothetical protein
LSTEEPLDVAFRHLAIPTEVGDISGICLSYRSKEGAKSFFDFIHQYLDAPGRVPRKLVEVKATQEEKDTYSLSVEVGLGSQLRHIQIHGVAREYIDHIRKSLRIFAYYLITAGYDLPDGQWTMLPISTNHLFLSRIVIDDREYVGNPDSKFPWSELVQTRYIVYQSNE